MKKYILCALVALIAGIMPATAQDVTSFSSSVTGFSCIIPQNATVMKNDVEAIVIQTPDQEYVITAIPFQPSQSTDESNAVALKTLAESANIDLETASDVDITNKTMEGGVFFQNLENGAVSVVGAMAVKGADLAFYMAIVFSPNYASLLETTLSNIEFDPDAVK